MRKNEEKRILVVDDEPGIRIAVSMKLRMAGFLVEEATDGVEALEHLRYNPTDLVIADVGMPRMDGYTMCQKMHADEHTRGLPVIILTAQDMDVPDDVKANLGRYEFMMKPFSPRDLLAKVTSMFDADQDDQ